MKIKQLSTIITIIVCVSLYTILYPPPLKLNSTLKGFTGDAFTLNVPKTYRVQSKSNIVSIKDNNNITLDKAGTCDLTVTSGLRKYTIKVTSKPSPDVVVTFVDVNNKQLVNVPIKIGTETYKLKNGKLKVTTDASRQVVYLLKTKDNKTLKLAICNIIKDTEGTYTIEPMKPNSSIIDDYVIKVNLPLKDITQ